MLSKWRNSSQRNVSTQARSPLNYVATAHLHSVLKSSERDWLSGLPSYIDVPDDVTLPVILAVGGGKGGVGKSILSSNLAAKMGEKGYRVLLIDLDLGSANLHTYFGMSSKTDHLAKYLVNPSVSFSSLIKQTPAKNVALIAGGQQEGANDLTQIDSNSIKSLWSHLLRAHSDYQSDFVILDLGAGTHRYTIDFFSAAHMGLVTVLPEPTSIENAYSFLKAFMWRLVENVGSRQESTNALDPIKQVLFNSTRSHNTSYALRLRQLMHSHPSFVQSLLSAMKGRQVGFVVNQIRTHRDIDVGPSMENICKNYFGYRTKSLGYLNYDESAWKSLRNKRLLVQDFPYSQLSKRINEICNQLLTSLSKVEP